jgi:hypothetical protein
VSGDYSGSVSPYVPNTQGKNMGDYWNEDIVRTSVSNQKLDIEGKHFVISRRNYNPANTSNVKRV